MTDWALGHQPLLERVTRALQSRTGLAVQHRHPGVTTRQFFDEAREVAKVCARFNAPLFVNSRLDVALALGAHLHLAAKALSVSDVKPHLRTLIKNLFNTIPAGVGKSGKYTFNEKETRHLMGQGPRFAIERDLGVWEDLENTEANGFIAGGDPDINHTGGLDLTGLSDDKKKQVDDLLKKQTKGDK